MTTAIRFLVRGSCVVSAVALLAGCVVAPPDRGGGYDGGYGYHHDRDEHDRYRCHDRGDRDDRDDRDDRCRD